MIAKHTKMAVVFLLLPGFILAADYNIERENGERVGSYDTISEIGTEIKAEVKFNDGSTLIRENIFLNDPACPAKILSHTKRYGNETRFYCTSDYDCTYSASTSLYVENPIVAIDVRTRIYDVFGQYAITLAHREIQDFSTGQFEIDGAWDADYSLVDEMMTTVTYIGRVRLSDGTQWIYNTEKLASALSTLYLEQKFGEDDEEKHILNQNH